VNPDHDDLGPDAARARDAVRDLPPASADPEFRARLREGFVAGTLTAVVPETGDADGDPPRAVAGPRAWWSRPPLWVPLAAAAALALVLGIGNQAPAWQVTLLEGAGEVSVDGKVYATSDRVALAQALARGGELRLSPEVAMDLVSAGQVAVGMHPGAAMTLSPAPPRWWDRRARFEVHTGEVFITTGGAFSGAQLVVATREAQVEVVGTTFAVEALPQGTCVCVHEGRVRVMSRFDLTDVAVAEGERRFCFPADSAYSGVTHASSQAGMRGILERSAARLAGR
jgi:ferric-dicitrate binding protein FerR (iron transport regulator)